MAGGSKKPTLRNLRAKVDKKGEVIKNACMDVWGVMGCFPYYNTRYMICIERDFPSTFCHSHMRFCGMRLL